MMTIGPRSRTIGDHPPIRPPAARTGDHVSVPTDVWTAVIQDEVGLLLLGQRAPLPVAWPTVCRTRSSPVVAAMLQC